MKNPDEEISIKVSAKLKTDDGLSDSLVSKVSEWVRTGNCSMTDLIFLLESQKNEGEEGLGR